MTLKFALETIFAFGVPCKGIWAPGWSRYGVGAGGERAGWHQPCSLSLQPPPWPKSLTWFHRLRVMQEGLEPDSGPLPPAPVTSGAAAGPALGPCPGSPLKEGGAAAGEGAVNGPNVGHGWGQTEGAWARREETQTGKGTVTSHALVPSMLPCMSRPRGSGSPLPRPPRPPAPTQVPGVECPLCSAQASQAAPPSPPPPPHQAEFERRPSGPSAGPRGLAEGRGCRTRTRISQKMSFLGCCRVEGGGSETPPRASFSKGRPLSWKERRRELPRGFQNTNRQAPWVTRGTPWAARPGLSPTRSR